MRLSTFCWLLSAALVAPVAVRAQQPDDDVHPVSPAVSSRDAAAPADQQPAAQLLERARDLYARGAFAESRELLSRALTQTTDPLVLSQIHLLRGLAHAADGQRQAARTSFRAALTHDPALRIDPHRFKPALVATFEQVRRSLQAELIVTADHAGATIVIDGKVVGPAPFRGRLMAGAHRVLVRGPSGATLHRRDVDLSPGQSLRLTFAAAVRDPRQPRRPVVPRPHREARLRWTWVAGAGALAMAALGAGLGVAAIDSRNEGCSLLADKALPCDARSVLSRPGDRDRYLELQDSVAATRTAANVTWVVAAGLAVTTAALFWIERRAGRRRTTDGSWRPGTTRIEIGPAVGPATANLALQLSY